MEKKLWWNNREIMKLADVTIKQLLEAGVHLGHKTFRWNPKMEKFIFGSKSSIHIIDLVQTLELTNAALLEIYKCISSGGKILFVSTKKQAAVTIANLAKDTSQFYVNHRWLGGMLTNWKTISNSIKRYKKLSIDLKKENTGFTKKENLKMGIERDKLERSLGGIADMIKLPDIIFIIDTNVEDLAVKEAMKLKIPIVAVVDTNSDPSGIDFPIPGNDDARRAINLYCELVKKTILEAQKFIAKPSEEDLKNPEGKDLKSEDKKPQKKIETKVKSEMKKVFTKTPQKLAKSLLSKVKSLASIKKEK
jgi:small subunit ribosomal protein S2